MLVRLSLPRRHRASLACVLALGLALSAPVAAAAAVLHVAPGGSDAAAGSASAPIATISRAAALARNGDVVLVAPGRYHETIELPATASGVTFRGTGDARPVIDGAGTRTFGFSTGDRNISDVTIDRFELRDQAEAAISVNGSRMTITDNVIHHVGADGRMTAYGVHVGYGRDVRILDNSISSIGPGGQATGVLLTTMRETTVAGNEIRMIRKEGVRDSWGLDNVIRDNAISLCWTGLAFNSSTGSVATGNYLHDNVQGFNPKHVSEPRVLAYWGLAAPHWSRFHDNTVYRSTDSSVALAMNAPTADYLDLQGNIFSGAGGAFVADAPWSRGDHLVLDRNVYSNAGGRPAWAYHTGYDFGSDGLAGLADIRSALGWENAGRWDSVTTPRTSGATPSASALARATTGAQASPSESLTWTPLSMAPIDSSSPGTWYTRQHLDETADGVHHTYWLTETNRNEWVTYDFGGRRSFQQLVLDVYGSGDKRNVRGYRFEVSDDNRSWQTILAGQNPDALGSSYKYELPAPVAARYLRFTLVDTFCDDYSSRAGCGEYFVLSDLQAGLLESGEAQPVAGPEPVVPTPSPHASPTSKQPVAATAPAPRLSLGRAAVSRRRTISVRVSCEASRCAGMLTLSGGVRARRAFDLGRGTHLVTVPSRTRRRGRVRAVVRAQVDGRSAHVSRRLGFARGD